MNEQTAMAEPVESTTGQPIQVRPDAIFATDSASNAMISPQMGGGCGCNGARMSQNPGGAEGMNASGGMNAFVYAIGRVEARFPNLAAEKEFAQATGRATLLLHVNRLGRVSDAEVTVSSGDTSYDRLLRMTALDWQFRPARDLANIPVDYLFEISFQF